MAGILVVLAISWILLYVTVKKNIAALGFLPVLKRLKQFFIGFILTALLCFAVEYLEILLKSSNWIVRKNFSWNSLIGMLWWDLKSVLTEELVFRGALLFIVIKKIGAKKGILLSAIAFGIYHWFSFGIFGNIIPMIFVFIGTGLMGYAWAMAFYKTESIFLATGLHLGWNFTFNSIFSKGPLGQGAIIAQGGERISDWFSLVGLILVPLIVLGFVHYLIPTEENELKVTDIRTADFP